ncbi:hypothetical protein VTN00DRAFT_10136 [Thermoascus crustaceus]|uniref:uncharacterized protein n=1 Tax=Thermoascus crustaceus TaxID=5088 RepID=UPI003743ABDE
MREDSVPHELRTAAEPRQNRLYNVRLSQIVQVNPTIRLLRLALPPSTTEQTQESLDEQQQQPFTFLPGQWLDVHIPSIPQAGGFTITSTPKDTEILPTPGPSFQSLPAKEDGHPPVNLQGREPYVELAVQKSPSNPPAAWLWRPKEEIIGKELSVRVGGSFVWPPSGIDIGDTRNVVFVAGGVGINPLISMLSHITETSTSLPSPTQIHFLYSTRLSSPSDPEPDLEPTSAISSNSTEEALNQILFLPRLREIARSTTHSPTQRLLISLDLYLTNLHQHPDLAKALLSGKHSAPSDVTIHDRRIQTEDLRAAVGDGRRTVCFVCGPPGMTDEVVGVLRGLVSQEDGKDRVFCEKWW